MSQVQLLSRNEYIQDYTRNEIIRDHMVGREASIEYRNVSKVRIRVDSHFIM